MQHNLNTKNKSHVLRETEQAKRKSRHRLIGSIFLLLIALIVLLNIASKVKQPTITTEKIEIKNTATNTTTLNNPPHEASATISVPINTQHSASSTTPNKVISSSTIIAQTPDTSGVVINKSPPHNGTVSDKTVTVIRNNKTQVQDNNTNNNMATLNLSPRVVIEKTKSALTPKQILNGEKTTTTTNKYYIQIIALSDKNKIIQLRNELSQKGIKTIVQQITTPNHTVVYRLRMGPYSNKRMAKVDLGKFNK